MSLNRPLGGVIVATASFFKEDQSLSLLTFREHLEFLASQGVSGFAVCATTGEGPTLSRDERNQQIAIALEIARARSLVVLAGCAGNDTNTVLMLVKEAQSLGCDAALVSTPYYNKPTQAGLVAHFESLTRNTELPIVLYNVPSRTGVNLEPRTVVHLATNPNIIGIKEASGSYAQWLALATGLDLSSTALLAGDDDAYSAILALGGSGIISASANVAPSMFVEIAKAFDSGQPENAFAIQKKLHPLILAMFAETNPAPVKYALHRLRGFDNKVRLPLVPVSEQTQEQIDAALNRLELTVRL